MTTQSTSLYRALAAEPAGPKQADGCLGIRYKAVRSVTRALAAGFSAEDQMVQLQILTARHAPVCDPEGCEVYPVAGSFVVKAKVEAAGRVYAITNFNDTAAKTVPPDFQRCIGTRRERGGAVRQMHWIGEEGMLNTSSWRPWRVQRQSLYPAR